MSHVRFSWLLGLVLMSLPANGLRASADAPAPAADAPVAEPGSPDTALGDLLEKLPNLPEPSPMMTSYLIWLHRRLGQTVDESTAWVDSHFGAVNPSDTHATYGTLRVVPLWIEHQGWDVDTRFKARIELPNLSRRLHAVLGFDRPDQFVADRPATEYDDILMVGDQFEDREFLAGLGYLLSESASDSIRLGAGLQFRFPVEAYARARYVHLTMLGERALVRFQETLFARTVRGGGAETAVDFERALTDKLVGRFSVYGRVNTRDDPRYEVGGKLGLARALDRRRVIALGVAVRTEPDSAVVVRDYGALVIYRQLLQGDYFFGEVQAGYSWPRANPDEQRRASLNLGIGLELKFGTR